jgi:hypothetical protein
VVLSVFASLMNGEFYDNKPTPNENADCGFRGIDGFDIHVGAGMGMCVAAFFLSILQAILGRPFCTAASRIRSTPNSR